MVEVPLGGSGGGVALVDDEDAARVLAFRWHRHEVGRSTYARSSKAGYLHRLIAGLQRGDGLEVDHRDGNGLDNRRANLRIVTHAQNQQNRHRETGRRSSYRGVTWSQIRADRGCAPWVARVKLDGVTRFCAYFWDEREAGDAAAEIRRQVMPFSTT